METTLEAADATAGMADDTETIALWNPGAAVAWSLLLSPALGAYLHMRNWERMGQAEKAAEAHAWFLAVCIVDLVNLAVVTLGALHGHAIGIPPAAGLAIFGLWYVMSAQAQPKHVARHHGTRYRRRSWPAPLLLALAAHAAYLVLGEILARAVSR